MNSIRQPAEPKAELVECAIVELLDIARRQGITPADFIQLLDSGMHISDFLAAMTPLASANDSSDCDSSALTSRTRVVGGHLLRPSLATVHFRRMSFARASPTGGSSDHN